MTSIFDSPNLSQLDAQWCCTLSPQDCLTQLVACNTVSSTRLDEDHNNSQMIELLIQHLTQHHMFCLKFEQILGKFNLLAMSLSSLKALYTEQSLGLLFSGHADTVPFNADDWVTNPLCLTEKEGKLYGRGAVDMKGFIACATSLSSMTATLENTAYKIGDLYKISCLITSDEETSMDGAQMLSLLNTQPLTTAGCSAVQLIFDEHWAQQQALGDPVLNDLLVKLNAQTKIQKYISPVLSQDASLNTCATDASHNACATASSLNSLSTASAYNVCATPDLEQTQTYCSNLSNLSVLSAQETWLNQAFLHKVFDLIVIGEPTQMQAVIAHKGWMARTLKVQGKTAHSSNPDAGSNAISLLSPVLNQLLEFSNELKTTYRDERFAVPYVTLNLGHIHGGQAHNTVCDNVELDFDVRPIPCFNNQQIQERLQEITDKANAKLVQANQEPCFSLTIPFADIDCFENTSLASLNLLKQAILQLKDQAIEFAEQLDPEFKCVNYCTEASLLQKLGPCVVMGPGNIAQAHQENEFIELKQLQLCLELLRTLTLKMHS